MENSEVLIENEEESLSTENKYLSFLLAGEEYGIDIKYITEILGLQAITDLPEMPDYVKGVMNLRGKVIPVIDVRLKFKKEERDYDQRTCIIVTNINETAVGLIVDTVKEVLDISANKIDPAPKMGRSAENSYIQGLGKVDESVKIILDIDNLLYAEELNTISQSAKN